MKRMMFALAAVLVLTRSSLAEAAQHSKKKVDTVHAGLLHGVAAVPLTEGA